jgi:hypothetical protein
MADRKSYYFVLWLFAPIFLFLANSCSDDKSTDDDDVTIIVNPSGILRGSYTGTYQIIWNYGDGQRTPESVVEQQNIYWTFSDYTFRMMVPEDDTIQITNNCFGDYNRGDKMLFMIVSVEPGLFNPQSRPDGEFDYVAIIVKNGPDTLRFTQLSGEGTSQIYKTIKIVKIGG